MGAWRGTWLGQDKSTGEITDTTRLEEAFPTIEHLVDCGAKVVLVSHLGRPKGQRNEAFSLKPVPPDPRPPLPRAARGCTPCTWP